MTECKTKYYDPENLGTSYQSDTYDKNISNYTLNIIRYINSFNKNFYIEIGKNKLGAGSFGKVYDGVLKKKTKKIKINVAIKIIRIDENDSKLHNSKEVSILNKINKLRNSKNLRIAPKVYLCDFLCSKYLKLKDKCFGYQVIVMELKKPFNNNFFKKKTIPTLVLMLEKALENYKLVVEKGIYLFDIKPKNNVVDDDNNVYIIDTDPSYIFLKEDFKNSFFEKVPLKVFKLIFLTLIQLVYIMRYVRIIRNVFNVKKQREFLKIINNRPAIKKIVDRYIKYLEVIFRFLDYDNFKHKKDKKMRNLFFKYSITDLYGNINPSQYATKFNERVMEYFNLKYDSDSTDHTDSDFRNLKSSTYKRTSRNRMNVFIKRGNNTKKVSISSSYTNTL